MKKKLMKLYKEWCETGRMPEDGLCTSLRNKVSPRVADKFERIFKPGGHWGYWGYEFSDYWTTSNERVWYTFTPLRQTLMLLLIEIIDD